MTDSRDDAEFVDGDALGEEVGDDSLPGTGDFPPDHPWGVQDPTRDVGDDVATRELRRAVEPTSSGAAFELVAVGSSAGLFDDEAQEIASTVRVTDGQLPAEEDAIHIIEER